MNRSQIAMGAIAVVVFVLASCRREPSSAVIQGRADVTQAQAAIARAEQAFHETERAVEPARTALTAAREVVQQQQARCQTAHREWQAADAALSQARAAFQQRTEQPCCQMGQSVETDQAIVLARDRSGDQFRICNEDVRQAQLAEMNANSRLRGAEERVSIARTAIEAARSELLAKQERLRALEQAEAH